MNKPIEYSHDANNVIKQATKLGLAIDGPAILEAMNTGNSTEYNKLMSDLARRVDDANNSMNKHWC